MDNIKIIKLKTNLDIICALVPGPNSYNVTIHDPMVVHVKRHSGGTSLSMEYWLPLELYKDTYVNIDTSDILAVLEPNDSFQEYYIKFVYSSNKLLNLQNNLKEIKSEDEYVEILLAMEEQSFHTMQ